MKEKIIAKLLKFCENVFVRTLNTGRLQITSQIVFDIALTNVEVTLKQSCINVVQLYFDVVLTSNTNVVSTLCKVENPTSDVVLYSMSDQGYFNVDPQHWKKDDPNLKCWLGYWRDVPPKIKNRNIFGLFQCFLHPFQRLLQ